MLISSPIPDSTCVNFRCRTCSPEMAKESQTYSVNLGGLGSFPTRVVNSNPNGTFIFVF